MLHQTKKCSKRNSKMSDHCSESHLAAVPLSHLPMSKVVVLVSTSRILVAETGANDNIRVGHGLSYHIN